MSCRLSTLALLALGLSSAAACGSRSDLTSQDPASSGGAGGAGGATTGTTGTTSTSTTSTGTGGSIECADLSVTPIAVVPSPGVAWAPELALLPSSGDVVVAFLDAPEGAAASLVVGRADVFGAWPPTFDDLAVWGTGVTRFATGPGPSGPLALIHAVGGTALLVTTFFPDISIADGPITAGDEILFAAAIPDRYLFGQAYTTPEYDVLDLGSYQPSSLPQSEEPLVCLTSRVLGAAIPSGPGFLAAYLEPDPPEPGCNPQSTGPGTVVSVSRYEAPPGAGTFLTRTQGVRFVHFEPIVNLGLAPASFGGWVVFQTDGSTSRSPPPVSAFRVDTAGQALDPDEIISVSPGGAVVPAVAVAALGDTLAVAWIDAIDPSAPVIAVQLVRPDGSLGPATSIPTNEAWYAGHLRILASPGGDSLIVSWESSPGDTRAALARIDCVNPL